MPVRKFLVVASLLALAGGALAAPDPIVTTSWDEAQKLAAKHDLPILVDFYTDW